ncbi:MAG: formimidoylglutamase [Acidobacteria bacterium]|nr:formimidoylglutamase [Acidobacteriota bacterium]
MSDTFQNLTPPDDQLFFRKNDRHDPRLGEIVPHTKYEESHLVILGCPQDEGVRRNGGREGAALAPDAIREQFYRLTPFGIHHKICDLGNLGLLGSLEETHDELTKIAKKVLQDGKKLIVLGGGNDISYADGRAMSEVFGSRNWLGVNVDAHLDVRIDTQITSGTPYRRLLDEKLIRSDYLYEIGYQPQVVSHVYYRYLQNLGVNMVSVDQLRSRETADLELRELMRQRFVHHSQSLTAFFAFDLHAVRASDAPGTSVPSPVGLRSGEFLNLVQFAAKLVNTKMIEFTEVNPKYDVDGRTSKLVAVALHRFCSSQPKLGG